MTVHKNFISRLEKLETLNNAKDSDLSSLSDAELDRRLIALIRKLGYTGPRKLFNYAGLLTELQNDPEIKRMRNQ